MSDAPNAAEWRRDPTGRHAQRYFDGQQWTEHVADAGGNASTDPYDGPPAGASAAAAPGGPADAAGGGPSQASETIVVPSGDAAPSQPDAPGEPDPTTVTGPGGGINQPDPTMAYGAGEAAQATQAVGPSGAAPPGDAGWGGPTAAPPVGTPPGQAQPAWGAPPPPTGAPAAAPPWGAPPPPGGTAPAAYGQPAPPVYGAPAAPVAYGPVATGSRGMSPIGLIGALIGLALIVVGAFALKWYAFGGQSLKLSDIADGLKHNDTPKLIVVTKIYFQWGIYVALAVAVVFSVLAALVRKLAVVGFILALLAAAWHFWAVFDFRHWFHAQQGGVTLGLQPAVWVAGAGFVVCALASLIPGRRKSAV